MTASKADDGGLHWDVLTVTRPGLTRDLPPGKEDLAWVANSSTLIHGVRDAVLVDTFLTIDQSRTLVDWVVASGKQLVTIYITHGHGDHFFGLTSLLERFPQARAVAMPGVVEAMRSQLSEAWQKDFWRRLFPDQIDGHLRIADPLDSGTIHLEGHELNVVDTGRTDTAHSSVLHVPSMDLIVGGDAVYNGIHAYLGETNTESRLEWIAALERLSSLNPKAVVAGHKIPQNSDAPRIIAETQQYLRDFNRLDAVTSSARELYDAMLALYPRHANPGSLWGGANRAKQRG